MGGGGGRSERSWVTTGNTLELNSEIDFKVLVRIEDQYLIAVL